MTLLLQPETTEERIRRIDLIEQTELEIVALKAEQAEKGAELAAVKKKLAEKNLFLHRLASKGEPLPLFEGETNGEAAHPPTNGEPAWAALSVEELVKEGVSYGKCRELVEAGLPTLGSLVDLIVKEGNLATALIGKRISGYAAGTIAAAFDRLRANKTGDNKESAEAQRPDPPAPVGRKSKKRVKA